MSDDSSDISATQTNTRHHDWENTLLFKCTLKTPDEYFNPPPKLLYYTRVLGVGQEH